MAGRKSRLDGWRSRSQQLFEEQQAWHRLREHGDAAMRDDLALHYLPFARMMAARVFAAQDCRHACFDDCLQAAIEGLLQSIDRYAPAFGTKFTTFAQHRIEGAIRNQMRSLRAPQGVAVAMAASADADSLENLHPSHAETSIFLPHPEAADHRCLEAVEERDAYHFHAMRSDAKAIRSLVGRLSAVERTVIRYHYFFGLPFSDIATHLGISRGRVSQLHSRALARLKCQASIIGLEGPE